MKKYFIFASLVMSMLVSCSTDQFDEMYETINKEEVSSDIRDFSEATFSFGGEYITETETPLGTRAANSEVMYYAFDIDTLKVTTYEFEGIEYKDTTYVHFAEGLFTTTEKMKLHLPKNRTYRINASIVKEVGDTLYHEGNTYYAPFCESVNAGGVEMKNSFVVSETSNYNLDQIWINTDKKHSFHVHPKIDRYFGSIIYTPSGDKECINVDMIRFAFGLKFNITPPVDGVIKVTCSSPKLNFEVKSTDGTLESDEIYATSTTTETYKTKSNYAEKIYLNIVWEREADDNVEMQKEIDIKKNTKKIININFNNRDYESDFGFNVDDTMNEETEEIN